MDIIFPSSFSGCHLVPLNEQQCNPIKLGAEINTASNKVEIGKQLLHFQVCLDKVSLFAHDEVAVLMLLDCVHCFT